MNILSYIIRGGGNILKRKRILFLLNAEKVDVSFPQETKLTGFSDSIANSFWGGGVTDWTASNSLGASGGLTIIWKKGSLNVNYSFIGTGFVGINILWKGLGINLVNIYAPESVVARRGLWNTLPERNNKFANDVWCLGGDYNEITHRDDRIGEGGHYNRRGMEYFRAFIGHMELVDIR